MARIFEPTFSLNGVMNTIDNEGINKDNFQYIATCLRDNVKYYEDGDQLYKFLDYIVHLTMYDKHGKEI